MSRQSDILSRVYQNLTLYGVNHNSIIDEVIYDRLTQAQDGIISTVFPDRIVTVAMVTDQDVYHLGSDSTKTNIASIKTTKQPVDWSYKFLCVPNKEFADFVNSQPAMAQPIRGTIIGGALKVYPIPSVDYNGDELELYAYLSSSAGVIDKTNPPEIPEFFDTALELGATHRLLKGRDKNEVMSEYKDELLRVKPLINRKVHTMQAPIIEGW